MNWRDKVRAEKASSVNSPLASEAYIERLPFRADPFQIEACVGVEEGKSVLVAAPTGAGKTLVAEFAAESALAGAKRLYYTTPIKALSNQKYRDFCSIYGESSVGLLTGDNSINPYAPIVVMTTEVLRNMLYQDRGVPDDLRYVVLDEVHYLQDKYRGATWEEVIIELPESVQLVCLSATVSNLEEFGAWLRRIRGDVEVVADDARPVPLHNLYAFEDKRTDEVRILSVFAGEAEEAIPNPAVLRILQGSSRYRKGRVVRTPGRVDLVDELEYQDALPAIYFVFSRAGCEEAARQCQASGICLTTRDEIEEIRQVLSERSGDFESSDLEVLGFDEWASMLESGIATHHAGLIPVFKEIVEELFVRALVKVVFATETLSLGINMPARTVVIENLSKFNGRFHAILTPSEYTQLSGRAGRRGIDSIGYCVVVHSRWVPFTRVVELAGSRSYELESSFEPTYNMATNLIATRDRCAAEKMLASSFAQFRVEKRLESLASDLAQRREILERRRKALNSSSDEKYRHVMAEREKELAQQVANLERRIERRRGGLLQKFEAVLSVLEALDYVEGWQLTDKGKLLSGIYCERDLLVAEALSRGIIEGLDGAEIAAFVSSFTFEARQQRNKRERVPTSRLASAFGELGRLWSELVDAESSSGLEMMTEPDFSFASRAYRWASGAPLDRVLVSGEDPGDFVRNAKQVVDLCRQIMAVTNSEVFAEAARIMNRGLVAYCGVS